MSSAAMSPWPVVLGLAFAGILGAALLGLRRGGVSWERHVASIVGSGLVALYGSAAWLDLAGLSWSRATLAAIAGLAGLVVWLKSRRIGRRASSSPSHSPSPLDEGALSFSWGDTVALLAVGGFLLRTIWMQSFFPDWIYHWGVRAEKAFLAHGLPWDFLGGPSANHPIYPNLWPTTSAIGGILAGGFDAEAATLWSPAWLFFVLLTFRGLAREWGIRDRERQILLAGCGILLSGFAARCYLAGAADWFPLFGMALALGSLVGPTALAPMPRARGDLVFGCAAALCVGSKLEGVALGASMITAWLVVHRSALWNAGRRSVVGRLAVVVGPSLVVFLPWFVQLRRHHIVTAAAQDHLEFTRLPALLAGLRDVILHGQWSVLAPLVLLAPWALLASRRTRGAALAAVLHLGSIGYAYLAAPFDTWLFVWLSFDRILLHVFPLTFVALAGIAAGWWRRPASASAPAGSQANGLSSALRP
jgi:hypothetical protein